MNRVLVLGGGFGGISAALELRKKLPREENVTLIDDQGSFLMGLSKLWALDGRRPIQKGRRRLDTLKDRGVEVVHGSVEQIDLEEQTVTVGDVNHPWERLVVALGARLAPEATSGSQAAFNLYDGDGVTAFARELETFDQGRLLIAVCGMPFKCPPAPYEATMIAHNLLKERGVRDDVEITLTTPEPKPLPIAPDDCSGDLRHYLSERDIHYAPAHRPTRVDPLEKNVVYENGNKQEFDLLAIVPVHKVPDVVVRSGLAEEGGWVQADPATLATKHKNVWAIGDVTAVPTPGGKPLPKAGVFAEAQGKVVAHNIANELQGKKADARFDGHGHCYIETGDGRATAIEGNFFAQPAPLLQLKPPSEDAMKGKKEFEKERLDEWFGG